MSAKLIRTATLGEALPAVASLEAAAKGDIAAKLAGAIAAQARITANPPTLAANLQVAQQIVASLQAAVAVGLPTADFQLAALATLIADLQAQLAALLNLRLTEVGVSLYTWDGAQNLTSTGGILPPGVALGTDSGAIILSAVAPGARAAIKALAGLA